VRVTSWGLASVVDIFISSVLVNFRQVKLIPKLPQKGGKSRYLDSARYIIHNKKVFVKSKIKDFLIYIPDSLVFS